MSATPYEMDESILSAYVDGELDDDARTAVEQRLAESGEWPSVLEEVRATRDAVRSLPSVDAPAGYWNRVLDAGGSDVVDLAAARDRRARTRRFGGLAAARFARRQRTENPRFPPPISLALPVHWPPLSLTRRAAGVIDLALRL